MQTTFTCTGKPKLRVIHFIAAVWDLTPQLPVSLNYACIAERTWELGGVGGTRLSPPPQLQCKFVYFYLHFILGFLCVSLYNSNAKKKYIGNMD